MSLLVVLGALGFLMWVAYRGASVIVFAPVAALLAVLLTAPLEVAPAFSALFLERMADFLKSYFPVFLLGALFGKVIELSGFAQVIVAAVLRLLGGARAMPAVVLVCALLQRDGRRVQRPARHPAVAGGGRWHGEQAGGVGPAFPSVRPNGTGFGGTGVTTVSGSSRRPTFTRSIAGLATFVGQQPHGRHSPGGVVSTTTHSLSA